MELMIIATIVVITVFTLGYKVGVIRTKRKYTRVQRPF